jgi:hypothetical protein
MPLWCHFKMVVTITIETGSPLSIRPIRANSGWSSWVAASNSQIS